MNIKRYTITLGAIPVDVVQKEIKNLHLSVHPPSGRVTVAAPLKMDQDSIRLYVVSKLGWIKKHQAKLRAQNREAPREFVTRESHYFLGKRYLLKLIESERKSWVELKHETLELHVPADSDRLHRRRIMQKWYRDQLKEIVAKYITKWERVLSVKVQDYGIKRMKTKWGTCNREAARIWINLELAKKPIEAVEYIVVHEMVHLLERKHGERFIALMDKHLPQWRSLKEELNRFPVSHAEWEY